MTTPDWSQLTHRQLYEAVQSGPGRAISVAAEERWTRIETVITDIEQRISSALARSNGGWEGAAADATRAGVSPLGAWALDAAGDARLTAGAILAQAEHAAELRRLLPPPESGPGPLAGRIGVSPHDAARQAAAAADAKRLMHDYANHSYENDRYLDYWTVPPSVTVDSTPIGPPGTSGLTGPSAGTGSGSAAHGSRSGGSVAPDIGAEPPGASFGVAGPPGGPNAAGAGIAGAGIVGAGVAGQGGPGASAAGSGRAGSGPVRGGSGSVSGDLPPAELVPGGRAPGGVPGGAGPSGSGTGRTGLGGLDSGGRSEPTAGGRGPSRMTTPLGGGAVRPVVPEVPRSNSVPGWRDLVPDADQQPRSTRPGPTAEPVGRAALVAEESAHTTGSRAGTGTGMYPPMAAGGAGSAGGEHRRPSWLVDCTGAFDDDRWFPPAVITPDAE